jgi:hypothetical protein
VKTAGPRIDERIEEFVQGAVSILAASSDENHRPVIVRALGCRVSPDRRGIGLLIPAADPFVDVIRATGRIAVTFTEPSTHRTIQLKGTDASATALEPGDRLLHERYADRFVAEVCPLGFTEEMVRGILSYDPPDLVAVAFHPSAAFLQTPGPRAGDPMV